MSEEQQPIVDSSLGPLLARDGLVGSLAMVPWLACSWCLVCPLVGSCLFGFGVLFVRGLSCAGSSLFGFLLARCLDCTWVLVSLLFGSCLFGFLLARGFACSGLSSV
jgi:hypothetical protein